MTPERWRQIEPILCDALELGADARPAFLREACGGDTALLSEVSTLIRSHDGAGGFIDSPIADELLGAQATGPVGRYRLIEEIGRGGMGAVYLAERADGEFSQSVAIKIIKRGMDTDEIVGRFRRERQILAALDHPNIARLLDGGTSADGRPYFVMEFVDGRDLIRYAESRGLTARERLELFRKVCSAVSYAHSHLVVHRDLKPSNVLVTQEGEPKLLDFGISKLLAADGGGGAITAVVMLTPEYASPEQFHNEQTTTATDIYSLGVILHELLTGGRPTGTADKEFAKRDRAELETDTASASTVAQNPDRGGVTKGRAVRTGRPGGSGATLPGDLDTIVKKALRIEPRERYGSVEQFSEDIRRYLDGAPVLARPLTFRYRAGKFVKRHRSAVAAAVLLFLALAAGLAGTAWQAARAERERRIAQERFNDVRHLAHNIVFRYSDEIQNIPGTLSARRMLVSDALEYLNRLAEGAGEDADLQRELALAYFKIGTIQTGFNESNLGDADGAIDSFAKALRLQEAIALGSPNDAAIRRQLGQTHLKIGAAYILKGETVLAKESYSRARSSYESALELNPNDPELLLELSDVLRGSATNLGDTTPSKVEGYRQALEFAGRALSLVPDNEKALTVVSGIQNDLGRALGAPSVSELNDVEGAIENLRKSAEIRQKLYELHKDNVGYVRRHASSLTNLADVLAHKGEVAAALQHLQRASEVAERLAHDAQNNDAQVLYAYVLSRQADALRAYRKVPESIELHNKAIELFETHPAIARNEVLTTSVLAYMLEARGDALLERGDAAAAAEDYERAIGIDTAVFQKSGDVNFRINVARYRTKTGLALSKANQRAIAAEKIRTGIEDYQLIQQTRALPYLDSRVLESGRREIDRLKP